MFSRFLYTVQFFARKTRPYPPNYKILRETLDCPRSFVAIHFDFSPLAVNTLWRRRTHYTISARPAERVTLPGQWLIPLYSTHDKTTPEGKLSFCVRSREPWAPAVAESVPLNGFWLNYSGVLVSIIRPADRTTYYKPDIRMYEYIWVQQHVSEQTAQKE